MIRWDGFIPERRYAIFRNYLQDDYMIVVTGHDLVTAPKWGGFVKWVGGIKPSETRKLSKK